MPTNPSALTRTLIEQQNDLQREYRRFDAFRERLPYYEGFARRAFATFNKYLEPTFTLREEHMEYSTFFGTNIRITPSWNWERMRDADTTALTRAEVFNRLLESHLTLNVGDPDELTATYKEDDNEFRITWPIPASYRQLMEDLGFIQYEPSTPNPSYAYVSCSTNGRSNSGGS